jgi:hypothetical protein
VPFEGDLGLAGATDPDVVVRLQQVIGAAEVQHG